MAEREITDVPYIGESTAFQLRKAVPRNKRTGKLTPEKAARLPQQVLEVKLDKRQRKELAKAVGDPENRFLTREEKSEIARKQQSGPREPGDTIRRGDFKVDRELFKEGRQMHNERSADAQRVDEQRRARVTTDFSQWANNMGAFDYPGIDTPNKRKPRRQEKDRGFVDNNALLRPFENEQQSNNSIPQQTENQGREGEPQSFGEKLREARSERGNITANGMFWEKKVREFEEEDMSVEFDDVTRIAGQVVVGLGDFFEGDDGGVDAVVSGLADRGAPVVKTEGTERVRIDVSDRDRPIPYRERDKSITGRFAEEL